MKLLADLSTAAVERPLVTCLAGVFLALLGLFSAVWVLPIQQEPPVKIPVVTVAVPYPGASPWEVQSEVVRELEDKLKGLEDVDHVYSVAAENFALTTVKFADDVDVETAKREVQDRVDQAKAEFPEEAEEPVVADVDFEDLPALFLTLTRSGAEGERDRTLMELNRIAENVEDRLLSLGGVSAVDTYGELEREVRLRLDPRRMEAYGLSFAGVAAAVAAQNLSLPGGTLDLRESTLSVRVAGRFARPEGLAQVVVGGSGTGQVHLRDILHEVSTIKKATSYSRMGGRPAVTLVLRAKTGVNMIRLVAGVKEAVAGLREEGVIPAGVDVTWTKDQSFWIRLMLTQLGSSALFGGILVVLVLYFGMGLRSGFLIASAIPFSILFCCLCQAVFGLSINSMTLFSLILILGMVVDGAIVVGENIYRHFEMGKRPRQAVLDGVHEVGLAVIAADLTTIAAFLPMLFMTGVMGFWMEIMPLVVAFMLAGSILVDHFFLPVLARYFMRIRPVPEPPAPGDPRWRAGPIGRAAAFLARHRTLAFLLCLPPAVPLGLGALRLLERLAAPLLAAPPDWSGDGPTRLMAVFLAAVAGDLLVQRWLGRRLGRMPATAEPGRELHHLLQGGKGFTRAYQAVLRFALANPFAVILFCTLSLGLAIGLPASGRLPLAFFQDSDTGWYFIKFELPPGSSIESGYRFAGRLERVLEETLHPARCRGCGWSPGLGADVPICPRCGDLVRAELKSTVTTLGEASAYAAFQGDIGLAGPEFGQIEVELTPEQDRLPVRRKVKRRETFAKSPVAAWLQALAGGGPGEEIEIDRHRSMFEIVERQKEWVAGRFPGVKVTFSLMAGGPPVGEPITLRVRGRSLPAIVEVAKSIEGICRATSECTGVQTTHFEGRREVRVRPDRDRAAAYGLSPADLARSLFTAFQGWEVAKLTLDDEEVDIRVENADPGRRSLADVEDLQLLAPDGRQVALRDVARVEVGATVAALRRYDRRQSITVTSQIVAGADEAAVKGRVREAVERLPLPRGVSVEFGGEDEEQEESVQSLLRAFAIAVVLIFFILTGQFGSFRQPLVVMATIPLAMVGALGGLCLTGNPLDFLAMVGIVCLAGIVVNDAIVLVDFTNQLRRRGVPLLDAVLLAGKARLRPILMTTITTVVGLLPLTLNLTGGGDFWETMGFSIIWGLSFATLLTLVVIPTLYTLVELDPWEAPLLRRPGRAWRLRRHRRRLARLLGRLEAAGGGLRDRLTRELGLLAAATEAEAAAAARELLARRGHELRRAFFARVLARLPAVPEADLAPLAGLCRGLSGCRWRVDDRLGEHQRPLLADCLAAWLRHDGRRAPAGALAAMLEAGALPAPQ